MYVLLLSLAVVLHRPPTPSRGPLSRSPPRPPRKAVKPTRHTSSRQPLDVGEPLRTPRRWTFSIKGYYPNINEEFGRSRLYWDTPSDDFFGAHWAETEPVQWQGGNAENLDPVRSSHPSLLRA